MNFLKGNRRVYWKLIKGYIRTNLLKRDQIRFVEIMLTYACNARCGFCSCKALLEKSGKILTIPKIKSLIDECDNLGVPVISFLGGEPLLMKDLPELINYAHQKGILPAINTNASLLTADRLKELKKAGLGFMSISLLSADPRTHNEILQIDNLFEHVTTMLKLARNLNLAVNIATVFTHNMFKDGSYQCLVNLARDLKIRININNFIPAVLRDLSSNELLSYEDNLELERLSLNNTFVSTHLTNNFYGYGCPMGNCYVGITPYGDALPCFFVPISFGNVWENSIASVFGQMLKVPFFKARPQLCLAGESKEFINNYLAPLFKETKGEPMPVTQHPQYNPQIGTLENLRFLHRSPENNI